MKAKKLLAMMLACTMVLGATACGSDKTGGETASTSAEATENGEKPLRLALIYSGFLGDKSTHDLLHEGALELQEKYGIEFKELESNEPSEWEANTVAMAEAGYDVVLCDSTQFLEILEKHAPDYPDTKFVLMDGVSHAGDNVASYLFAQNEVSFLAGAAAAMWTTHTELSGVNDQKVIGWVGGMDIPVLHDFYVGYEQGAKYVDPDITVLQAFAGSFTDALKGKELATAQINQGADIIMNVANVTGIGAMEAAADHGVYAIGVDTNQDDLYPGHVITSAKKNMDVGIVAAMEAIINGEFAGGTATYMDLAHNGVALTDFAVIKDALGDQFPDEILDELQDLHDKIVNGEIVVDSYEGYEKPVNQ